MNRTLALIAVVLSVITAFYVINIDDGSDGYETDYLFDQLCPIVDDADTVKFTNDTLPGIGIFLDCDVGDGAFENCTDLMVVYCLEGCTSIGDNAFRGCTNLGSVIMENVSSIGSCAFQDTGLGQLILSSNLSSIGEYAFSGCGYLTGPVLTGTNVRVLPNGAFAGTQCLIEDLRNIETIADSAFDQDKLKMQILNEGQASKLKFSVPCMYVQDIDIGESQSLRASQPSNYHVLQMGVGDGVCVTYNKNGETVTSVSSSSYWAMEFRNVCTISFKDYDVHVRPVEYTFHFEEKTRMSDIVYKSGSGNFTIPAPEFGSELFEGWTVAGLTMTNNTIRQEAFKDLPTTINPIVSYGSGTLTLDHSAVMTSPQYQSKRTETVSFTVGDSYPVLDDIPGYTFLGWNVGGDTVDGGSAIETFTDHTAKSLWNAGYFTLTVYDWEKNPTIRQVRAGGALALSSLTTEEPVGLRFMGWSLTDGGAKLTSNPVITSDLELYPVFEERAERTVTFKDGSTVLGTQRGYDGRTFTISQNDPSSDGKSFTGWKLGDQIYRRGDSLTLTGDTILQAQWDGVTVSLTYHMPEITVKTYDWGSSVRIGIAATKENHTLSGWSTTSGGAVAYNDGQTVTVRSSIDLYPVWTELEKYTVTVHHYNGTTEQERVYNGSTFEVPGPTARDGYTFGGWATFYNGSKAYDTGSSFTVTRNVDLYEIWTENRPTEYTVHVHHYDGSDDTTDVVSGRTFTIPIQKSREGYTFQGWATSPDGSVTYVTGRTLTVTADIHLYEVWEKDPEIVNHLVMLHRHTGTTNSTYVEDGNTYTIPSTSPRSGYTFVGWSTSSGGPKVYDTGSILTITKDIHLYELWAVEEAVRYTVTTHDFNGREYETRVESGRTFTIPAVTAVHSGYTFKGWSTSAFGTVEYESGRTLTITGDVDLYEVWKTEEVVRYTVTTHDFGGRVVQTKVQSGGSYTLPAVTAVHDGYTFKGWSTTSGGNTEYESGRSITVVADIDLYEVWEQVTKHTVTTHDFNGRTYESRVVNGGSFTIPAVTATHQGYTFKGWSSSAYGTVEYDSGSRITVTRNIDLYEVWDAAEPSRFTVITHDFSGKASETKVESGRTFTVPYVTATHQGYTFKGWSSVSNGSVEYQSGATITVNRDIDLYEIWEENRRYTVTTHDFDNRTSQTTVEDGGTFTTPSVTATHSGYTFKGWSTRSGGSVEYDPGRALTINRNLDLYEVWEENITYTVTLHDFDGRTSKTTLEAGERYTIPDVSSTHDGYTFMGWATRSTASAEYGSGKVLTILKNTDLYEVWEENTKYTVTTHDFDGRTVRTAVDDGGRYIIPDVTTEYDGYVFKGWSSSSGGSAEYEPGRTLMITRNIDLYEVWEERTRYIVTTHDFDNRTVRTSVEAGMSFRIPAVTATHDGYDFVGWSTRSGGSVEYLSGDSMTVLRNADLYEIWEEEISFTVTTHDHINKTKRTVVPDGGRFTVPEPSDEQDGYTFAGWSTRSKGSVEYNPGDIITVSKNTDLYEVWEEDVYYTVTTHDFDNRTKRSTVPDGGRYTIPEPSGDHDGYSFAGWSTRSKGSVEYDSGDYLTVSKNTDLYEIWEEDITYTVTTHDFDNRTKRTTVAEGGRFTVPDTTGDHDGYSFMGWSTRAGGSVQYRPGDYFAVNRNTDLYEIWEEDITYTVTTHDFDNRTRKTTVPDGGRYTIPEPTGDHEGYTFAGWSTRTGGSAEYDPGKVLTVTKNIDLYEVWEEDIVYTVTTHDFSNRTVKTTVKDGGRFTVPDASSDHEGYAFMGWSLRSGATPEYGSGKVLTVTGNIDLYEVWEENVSYTITIHDHDNRTTRTVIGEGGKFTVPEVQDRDGYTFVGWATRMNSSAEYDPGRVLTVAKSMDLYEVWEENPRYTVTTHDFNNRTSRTVVEGGKQFTVPGVTATHSGYTFAGWATAYDGDPDLDPGTAITVTRNTDLYEIWIENARYAVVTHDFDGRTSRTVLETGSAFMIPDVSATHDGFTFAGWATSAKGSPVYNPGESLTVTKNMDLYEIWDENTKYNVTTHDHNGRTTTVKVESGKSYTIPDATETREGFDFSGWAASVTGAAIYEPGKTVTVNGNMDLFEVWKAKGTFKVTVHSQPIVEKTAYEGSSITVDLTSMSKEGYDFLGWATAENSSVAQYPSGTATFSKATDLYPVWKEKSMFKVTLHTQPAVEKTAYEGSTVTIDLAAMEKEGYDFLGWSTTSGSLTAEYISGSLTLNRTTDLYPVWKAKTVIKVTVHTQPVIERTAYEGNTIAVDLPDLEKDGYDFLGWSTSSGSTLAQYAPGSLTLNRTADLYPVWKAKEKVNVIIHMAGSTTRMESAYAGESLTLPTSMGTSEGRTHEGWTTKADGTGRFYSAGSVIYPTASLELFPFWSDPEMVKVSFKDGDDELFAVNVQSSTSYPLINVDTPEKDGSLFLGWSTYRSATTASYSSSDSLKVNGAMVLYAVWEKLMKVTLADGDSVIGSENVRKNETFDLSGVAAPTKDGYEFLGWSTSKTGTATYGANGTVKVSSNMTLYAVWEKHLTVTLMDGDAVIHTADVRKNDTYELSETRAPSKEGYEFLGWSTSKTGTATYGAEGSVKVASNMTLYAVWEKHLTVTLMDGDTVLHTSEVRKNDTYELSETRAPEKEGYEFLGWSTSRTGTASIQQEGSVKVTSNLTLYAVWGKLIAITFVNGDDSETSYYKAGENVDLQRLYREGYTFLGWGPKGSDSTFSSLKASKDMELYPKWLKDQAESKAVAEPASTGSFMGDNLGYTAIAVGAIVAGMVSVLLVFQMRRN